jgi:transposase
MCQAVSLPPSMARPYSEDFRQAVIRAIELDGLKKSEASQLFNISRNTINLWLQRKDTTGSLKPIPHQGGVQPTTKITDWQQFEAFVKAHGDKTQKEIAQQWDGEMSQRTISRALRKIGYTRKKRPTAITNATKQNEQPF